VPEDVDEKLLASSEFFLNFEGKTGALLSIDQDASAHSLENRPQHLLLRFVNLFQSHLASEGEERSPDFICINEILTIIDPPTILILSRARIYPLPFIFPVDEEAAIHRGEEAKILRGVAEERVLPDHRVLRDAGEEVKPAEEVLAIVDDILPYYLYVLVCKNVEEEKADEGLLFLSPVPRSSINALERYTDSIKESPRDPKASNVACLSFKINGEA
jgi:hypothetical protein